MGKIKDPNVDGCPRLRGSACAVVTLEYYSLTIHLNQSVAGRTSGNELSLILQPRFFKHVPI